MKSKFYLNILLCFFSLTAIAQPTYQFQNFSMGTTSDGVFTTNNFKAIAIGKGGLVWAGTQNEGLYTYSTKNHVWTKTSKLTNVFINDIKVDADSGIWIAQSGTGGGGVATNLAGGVNYFPIATDQVMSFYTVPGPLDSGRLASRNVRSIYLDTAFKAADGELPRPWVASANYKTSGVLRKGGVNVGLNAEDPHFSNLIFGLGLENTMLATAVGGNSDEVWIATRLNGIPGNTGSKIVRYRPDKHYIGQYEASNVPELQAGFTAQAIFFDGLSRNKWVGMKEGGLRILTPNNGWLVMNSASFFDAYTQVNNNAITEDEFGNVWIGTTAGLLMYQSPGFSAAQSSRVDFPQSYKLFTTGDGLLNNNVTGVAYDKERGQLLITSDAGVSFLKIRYPNIHGAVFNVSTDIENPKMAGLVKKAFEGEGIVKVYLKKDGVEKEMVYPKADGSFELKEAEEDVKYTVEVVHQFGPKKIKYIYNDIMKHTRLQPSLLPIGIIEEIEAIIPKLETRCFPMKLSFGIEIPDLICTKDGFNTFGYDAAYDWVYDPAGVTTDHRKHVDNLANYYAGLATVYNIGGQSADLIAEATSSLLDAIESMAGEFTVKKKMKAADLDDAFGQMGEEVGEELVENATKIVNAFREGLVYVLTKSLVFVKDKSVKTILEKLISGVNEGAELIIKAAAEGRGDAIFKALKDNIKRTIAQYAAIYYYDQLYAQTRHEYFVRDISLAAHNIKSDVSYEEAYEKLYSETSPSLVKKAKDVVTSDKATMATLVNGSKLGDNISAIADVVAYLAVVPGGQAIAAAARALSFAAKAVKYLLLSGAVLQGTIGAIDVATYSDTIQLRTALQRPYEDNYTSYSNTVMETTADSLMARKIRYNQKLSDLQVIYAAGSFNVPAYKIKRKEFKVEDSLFNAELKNVLNSIVSVADTAGEAISNFTLRYDHIVDSFVNYQSVLKKTYHYRNLSYITETNKSLDKPGIDSVIVDLKVTNDSIVNGLQDLLTEISSNNILGRAFLKQDGYAINFSRALGANGTVSYSFKNYGGEPQNNVSFKITDIQGGYTILGVDSINVGTILAGQTKTVSFNFKAPMHDSMSHYRIAVKANNGRYSDATGSFYAINPSKCYTLKNGNWNDPATWSCGVVPGAANPVVIAHDVLVTTNATCKDVKLLSDSKLTIQTGKNLNIIP